MLQTPMLRSILVSATIVEIRSAFRVARATQLASGTTALALVRTVSTSASARATLQLLLVQHETVGTR